MVRYEEGSPFDRDPYDQMRARVAFLKAQPLRTPEEDVELANLERLLAQVEK